MKPDHKALELLGPYHLWKKTQGTQDLEGGVIWTHWLSGQDLIYKKIKKEKQEAPSSKCTALQKAHDL